MQLRRPIAQWRKREIADGQGLLDGLPVATQRNLQGFQQLFGVQPACGMGAAAVHQDFHAVLGQEGFGEAGEFLRAFFLVPQQHQEGAELGVFDLPVEQHAHGFAGFLAVQAAGTPLALAEDAHELRKRMFLGCFGDQRRVVGHRQFVGLGRPASLAASLAGVPLNRRLRCRLLPFSAPSFKAVYLISGRVAGDRSNSW